MHTNFFSPSSVVIIGASTTPGKIGNDMCKNLHSFTGKKYGINPKNAGENVYGVPLYESISELPEIPDLAVIVIPSKYVSSALEDCGKNGIKNMVIISAGFKEMGNVDGEEELITIANKYDIDLLGPNCLGFLNPHLDLNLSFASSQNLKKGNIALVSQSGAMAVAMMDWARDMNIGFSKIISMGNKSDIHENDFLEYLANDSQTDVIVMYLESIVDGRGFYEKAKKITKHKPVIIVKSGISKKGALAASSHTGALSGEKEVLETALKQAGIHSTHSLEEMFLWSETFANIKNTQIPQELIIITNAGGPGVMSVDNAEKYNIQLSDISAEYQTILMKNMPEAASMKNPLDILGDADSVRYKQVLGNITKYKTDKGTQKIGLLILLTPQTVTDTENIAEEIINFQKQNPDIFIMTSFMGGASVAKGRTMLKENNILHFDYPRDALKALNQLQKQYQLKIENEELKIDSIDGNAKSKIDVTQTSGLLPPYKVSEILKAYKIPFAEEKLIISEDEINNLYTDGQKGVMKISSPDIAHKTDIGGVIMNIDSLTKAKESYHQILSSVQKHLPNSRINGVTYQQQFPPSREVFLGMTRDATFGEMMIFGLGGIYLNVFEDVARRIAPISKKEIRTMISEVKSYPILQGARGESSIDFDALEDIILKVSQLFHSNPEIKEIDINPIFCLEDGAWVMDAKIFV